MNGNEGGERSEGKDLGSITKIKMNLPCDLAIAFANSPGQFVDVSSVGIHDRR